MRKLSYTDFFDLPNPIPKDYLKFYDKCYKVNHAGKEGFVLVGYLQEIFVPKECLTQHSIQILNSLPMFQPGGFVLN